MLFIQKVIILKKEKIKIPMLKKITIGDPIYFDYEEEDKLVYKREFKENGKWIGSLQIFLEKYYDKNIGVSFLAAFAPNKVFLETYESNMYYKNQEKKFWI